MSSVVDLFSSRSSGAGFVDGTVMSSLSGEEQESRFFFNMRYFEDMVTNGEWDEVEKYLFGFTKVNDNRYSMKIFFEIRKQKYLEALSK
ncbi:Topless-related protein 4 [Glycine soja]|nr:Topless-related protein 4 [Glycine soja]